MTYPASDGSTQLAAGAANGTIGTALHPLRFAVRSFGGVNLKLATVALTSIAAALPVQTGSRTR